MQKKSLLFFIIKLIKMPLTVLTLVLTAKYFGVGIEKDVWLLALAGITMIDLALWGPVNETFRAKFVILKETEGEKASFEKVQSLLFFIFAFSIILVAGLEFYPSVLVKFIAPGFKNDEYTALVKMIRVLAPFLLLNQFTLICTSILNAFEKFYIPELASFVSQIINIILIVFFANYLGIMSLAIALYISTAILIFFLIFQIRKEGLRLSLENVFKFHGFKLFFLFALPFFIPYFIGQISGMIEKIVATELGIGTVSILDFSKRLPEMLNGILITVVLTILVPVLTKAFVNKEKEVYKKEFLSSYKLGLFGLISFIAFFINGADPLLRILYNSNAIVDKDLESIIFLSKLFAGALIGVFVYVIFGMSMLSINRGKLYAIYGTVAQLLLIVFNFILAPKIGVVVFPLSYFFAHFISAIFMSFNYPYEKSVVWLISLKYFIFGIISVTISYYLYKIIPSLHFSSFLIQQSYQLMVSLLIGFFVISFLGLTLKINELTHFCNLFKRKIKK